MVKTGTLRTLGNLAGRRKRGAYNMILTKIGASPINLDPDWRAVAATNQGIHRQLYAPLAEKDTSSLPDIDDRFPRSLSKDSTKTADNWSHSRGET